MLHVSGLLPETMPQGSRFGTTRLHISDGRLNGRGLSDAAECWVPEIRALARLVGRAIERRVHPPCSVAQDIVGRGQVQIAAKKADT